MNLRKTEVKCPNCSGELKLVDSSNGGNDFEYWRHKEKPCGVYPILSMKLEKLSELEHEQWMKWSKVVAQDIELAITYLEDGAFMTSRDILVKRLEKWKPNWKPYQELPNAIQEYDRIWARKVLELLK